MSKADTIPARRQRICIGAAVYSKVDPEILEDWMRMMGHFGRRMPEYDFCTAIRTKTEQFRARNSIVEAAQIAGADWILMLDDDNIIDAFTTTGSPESGAPDVYGFLSKMLAHNKDICGALYFQRSGDCAPVAMKAVGENGYRFLRDDELTGGLQRVDVAGGGCLLVKMALFDRLKYPYFEPEFKFGTDVQLCRKALEKGFEVWLDSSIEIGHLRDQKTIVTSRNRMQFQLNDGVPGEAKKMFMAQDIYNRLMADVQEFTGISNMFEMDQMSGFIDDRDKSDVSDVEWYRMHSVARVCRQMLFNTQFHEKRNMTEFILASIDNHKKLDILDFGCGIGVTAFTLAEKGHNVTACDIRGTGTLEFLKWRCKKYNVKIEFLESEGGPPELGDRQFHAVIAMDSIEHIEDWRGTTQRLARTLRSHGVLFSNNGILEDTTHGEHYSIDNKEFISLCMDESLMPYNPITFVKKEKTNAKVPDQQAVCAV